MKQAQGVVGAQISISGPMQDVVYAKVAHHLRSCSGIGMMAYDTLKVILQGAVTFKGGLSLNQSRSTAASLKDSSA